jgi:tetratricopeptide (TPR) repeat protein
LRFPQTISMKPRTFLAVIPLLYINLILFVKAQADVDPGMVGTWETSGVNEHGPWKLTWEIHADSSYKLSGALSDSGIIGSGEGRWHTRSNITKQSADGTYNLRDSNHMEGAGPAGSGVWTRVGNADAAPAASSESNPFANVFPKESKRSTTEDQLSREEKDKLWSDFLNASHNRDSRDRLEKKARDGIAMAQVLFGMQLQAEKSFAEAASWYRKAAEQGDRNGMRDLGVLYRDGTGLPKDPSQAMSWFRKAADLGDVDALYAIGNLYSDGIGVAKDEVAAVEWYRKGAAQGDKDPMTELGACYWSGKGVDKSAREAINWWKQAAEKGDENAQKNLKMALEKFDEFGQPRTRK